MTDFVSESVCRERSDAILEAIAENRKDSAGHYTELMNRLFVDNGKLSIQTVLNAHAAKLTELERIATIKPVLLEDAAKRISDAANAAAERVAAAAQEAAAVVARQHDTDVQDGGLINRSTFSLGWFKTNGLAAILSITAVICLVCAVFSVVLFSKDRTTQARLESLIASAVSAKVSAVEARLTQKDQTKTLDQIQDVQLGGKP